MNPSGIRILLVEDNPGDADLIEAYLEPDSRVDARIIRAETLAEALEEMGSSSELDIALLDLTLPDSEGIGTLERLRAAAPQLPIILLTGSQDEELVWAAIQRGADDYLPKNELTPDLLARSIRYTLDRADAERAIRQREEWFRSLVENVTDLVVTVDVDGRLKYVSPSQKEILGHDMEAFTDANVLDIVHPDHRDQAAEALERLGQGADAVEFEIEVRTASGEWRVVAGDARNLLDSEAVSGLVITGRDITEAVERERELRRKDAILEAVSVASEELLAAGGLEDVLTDVLEALGRATGVGKADLWVLPEPGTDEGESQASAVYRWTAEDHPVPESGFSPLFPGESDWRDRLRGGDIVHLARNRATGAERAILEAQRVASMALIPVIADGSLWGVLRFLDRRRSHGWSEAEVDALGAAGAILGAAVQRRRDEAKIRERDQELLRAQKMEAVGRLAGGIAHDFNNLLTAIGGYASFISERVADASVTDEVREIERAADRGGRLTKQLLAFSRQQVVDERVFEPRVVVGEIEPLLTRLIGEHIRFTTVTGEADCPVRMDPSQLEQILMNLVLNARDALEDGGRIDITVAAADVGPDARPMMPDVPPAGRYARVTVQDNGKGMDPETRERVFEPFFTTKGQGEGTGLGLATVYGIVEGVGGYIDLASEPDWGTRVEILLPVTDGEVETASDSAPETVSEDASGTVLVVEDEDGVRGVAVRCLERRGYSVIAAGNGREALEKVDEMEDTAIDVLLTDVVMPEVGGVELARELRRRFPSVKVLLTSGYTQDELVQKGLDDHELDFIPKPYTPADLANKVASIIRRDPQTA